MDSIGYLLWNTGGFHEDVEEAESAGVFKEVQTLQSFQMLGSIL